TLSYKKARLNHLYPWIDRRDGSSRALRGIYSNEVFDSLEVIQQEVQMEAKRQEAKLERILKESFETVDDTFLEELEAAFPFNCEHVVPQSWFNKEKQPKTDLHHLFTCEWGCNSFRSNHAYFEFPLEAIRENCGENAEGKFEPKHGKGAVARATLYFLVRYPGKVADSSKEMPRDRIKTIIEWAANDKVDRWEKHRNAEIHKVQGNRNPFIDFPELVTKVDFMKGLS
ncbi:MAG: endonuclease I family protein, partial [Allomuricauda sp.]